MRAGHSRIDMKQAHTFCKSTIGSRGQCLDDVVHVAQTKKGSEAIYEVSFFDSQRVSTMQSFCRQRSF
jgi:hypothetical protein